jgi:hypothetical protein
VAHGLLGEPIDTAAVALRESQGSWYNNISGEWYVAVMAVHSSRPPSSHTPHRARPSPPSSPLC